MKKVISTLRGFCLSGISLLLCHGLYSQEAFTEMGEMTGLGVSFSQGMSVVDYNADGLDDIFITRRNDFNQLFKNLGNGRFTDVAREAGLDYFGKSNQTIWADYDHDGDLDAYLTIDDEPNKLYQNQGNDTFVDVAEAAGVAVPDFSTAAIWGDVNGDGLLDLFVIQLRTDDVFFLNNGDGTFRDYSTTAGIGQYRLSMGATFIDFDKDNDLDLYLSHDGHEGNFMYENNGLGQFTDVTNQLGMYTDSEAMGVSVGDFNNDGWPDLYLTNNHENFLFRNEGGSSFTEIAQQAGVDDMGMGWGVSWLDFDNDGLLDLYIANDSHFSDFPNLLYRNNGNETFTVVDEGTVIASKQGSYSTAIADLDRNGLPDLLLANRGTSDLAELFVNNSSNDHQWLVLELQPSDARRSAIGATVEVITDKASHMRYLFSGTGWSADDSKSLLFGLGDAESIEKVIVTWPNGQSTEHNGLEFGHAYELSDAGEATMLEYQNTPLKSADDTDPGDESVITSLEPDPHTGPEIKVFPNPSAGDLTLSLHSPTNGPVKIDLVSLMGATIQNLYDQMLPAGHHQLSLRLPKGTSQFYLLRLSIAEQVYFRKIIRKD